MPRQPKWKPNGGFWRRSSPTRPAEIDDYYEPFDFDYDHLHAAPEMKADRPPRAAFADHRPTHGEDPWGLNWEEILGGEFAKRSRTPTSKIQKDIYGQFENTFMMYLPRLCEHC